MASPNTLSIETELGIEACPPPDEGKKRKRGRPPKVNHSSAPSKSEPSKKSGRPRIRAFNVSYIYSDSSDDERNSCKTELKREGFQVKRPRGRPPKCAAIKRPRGRPRKECHSNDPLELASSSEDESESSFHSDAELSDCAFSSIENSVKPSEIKKPSGNPLELQTSFIGNENESTCHLNSELLDNIECAAAESSLTESSAIKRTRGRPSKPSTTEKPRGKPSKDPTKREEYATLNPQSSTVEDDIESSFYSNNESLDSSDYVPAEPSLIDNSIEPFATKKPRGRPRKDHIKMEKDGALEPQRRSLGEEINSKAESSQSSVIKRRRGRPRKDCSKKEGNDTLELQMGSLEDEYKFSFQSNAEHSRYLDSEENSFMLNEGEECVEVDTPVKRPRGRPPKTSQIGNDLELMKKPTATRNDSEENPEDKRGNPPNQSEVSLDEIDVKKTRNTGQTRKITQQVLESAFGKGSAEQGGTESEVLVHRRGRKPKNYDQFLDPDGESTCMVCNVVIPNTEWISHKRDEHYNLAWRKGHPPLDLTDPEVIQSTLKQLLREQGYLKCKKCDSTFKKPGPLIAHLDLCLEIIDSQGLVQCAVCMEKMKHANWSYHRYRKHANLAWRVGDTPLNFDDRDLVFKILSSIYRSKRPFFCDVCDKETKSVMGFLSHKSVCQKDGEEVEATKVTCSLCGRKMMPVSMDSHLREHSKSAMQIRPTMLDDALDDLTPRKAAAQALMVIRSLKEEGTSTTNAKSQSQEKDTDFSIDREAASCKNELSDSDGGDCADAYDEELQKRKKLLRSKANKSLSTDRAGTIPTFLVFPLKEQIWSVLCRQAYVWTLSFSDKNFDVPLLFNSERNSAPLLLVDDDILSDYLPTSFESCYFAVTLANPIKGSIQPAESNVQFTKLDLFESRQFHRGEATIFCGGPVTSLAWLPTPHHSFDKDQILAVAVLNEPGKEYFVGETYRESNVIQFWNFGSLNCEQDFDKPHFLFGLALNNGPVWHLEWCPSGCLDNVKSEDASPLCRLGLLAVAKSDSFVDIYSIDDVRQEDDRGLIYKGDPVLNLQLQDESSPFCKEHYATRISWTKASGHRYIAVGYSSGLVAVYDLASVGILRRGRCIFPYLTFQAHDSCITGLTLGHEGEGNRFCYSTSWDRHSIYWNLLTLTKVFTHRRNAVSEGLWLANWAASVQVDDETAFDGTQAMVYACTLREVFGPKCDRQTTNYLSHSVAGINAVSFGDWLNLILHGGNGGEVSGQFAHRLFGNLNRKRTIKYKNSVFSTCKLIPRGKGISDSNSSVTDNGLPSSQGILFTDYAFENLFKRADHQVKSSQGHCIEQYPLLAVRKLAVNPNRQACMFYVAGFETGFVRIRRIDKDAIRFCHEVSEDLVNERLYYENL